MSDDVLFRRQWGLGRITLNRPSALNALTHAMVRSISRQLEEWAGDDDITAIVLDGAGDRGLCAGGDIRAIYDDARSGGTGTLEFWLDEYRLNAAIARYPKPFVAIMDGMVMGGGVGLSAHASHRVVTERTVVAMPEVNIGLVPDVGGTYLLARSPGLTGLHAALTGTKLNGDDAIALGLADRVTHHKSIPAFIDLVGEVGAERALATLHDTRSRSRVLAGRSWIDACYAGESVLQIMYNLAGRPDPEAQLAAKAIDRAAPLSLAVTLAAMRSAATLPSLEAALNQDYRMVSVLFRAPDLVEGIRAQIVDKDRNPRWRPSGLDEVTPEMTAAHFADTPALPFPSDASATVVVHG